MCYNNFKWPSVSAAEKVETWTREYRGRTFRFSKDRKGQEAFGYNCSLAFDDPTTFTGETGTGVVLSVDLTRAQVESMKQFVDFMEGLSD
jgi:hypothetical protein